MSSTSIYSDGTYSKYNPTLHVEDSVYKMHYLARLLDNINWKQKHVKVLDIGGGAGELGKLVCEWFVDRGHTVSASVLDVSEEMITIQKKTNPYITAAYWGDIDQLKNDRFDLVLMIDVIEHIEDCEQFAASLNKYSANIAYNIPTDVNLLDILRNLAMRRRYYPLLTKCLGHVHFFSARSAEQFVERHHELVCSIFPEYSSYLLNSPCQDYVDQRNNHIRKAELLFSVAIRRLLPWLAPYIIQGSLFCLVKTK